MRLHNYKEYACMDYNNSTSTLFELGDVVINKENQIGIIIQVHDEFEFRTDMFGNCCDDEIRLATDEEINEFRPKMLSQNHFKKPTTIHRKTVRKELEQKLEVYSVEELIHKTKKVLSDLRVYPIENKWQINYYTIFWKLLLEY